MTELSMWRDNESLVLASGSAARQHILRQMAIPITVSPADIDERAVSSGARITEVAPLLALEKACAVSAKFPARMVLGADQTLVLGGDIFHKPMSRAQALSQLEALRGQTHELHSAAAIVKDGEVLFETLEVARLTMCDFSDVFAAAYLDLVGEAIFSTVGVYQIEALGGHLFEKIDGDPFTIQGLPLLPLLGFFRAAGVLL